MNINWKALGKSIGDVLKRRSPEILTGIGIAGMGASVLFAVRATSQAKDKLEHEAIAKTSDGGEVNFNQFSFKDKAKLTWKFYIPSAISFAAGATCVVFASRTKLRRNAALAAAYSVTETALQDYKTAAKEVLGEKKEAVIEDKARTISAERHEFQDGKTYELIGIQERMYDPWTDKDFPCNPEEMNHAIEDLSYALRDEEFMTLNDFYDIAQKYGFKMLGHTRPGEILGWNANGGPIRPRYTTTVINNKACLVLGFSRDPTDSYLDSYR